MSNIHEYCRLPCRAEISVAEQFEMLTRLHSGETMVLNRWGARPPAKKRNEDGYRDDPDWPHADTYRFRTSDGWLIDVFFDGGACRLNDWDYVDQVTSPDGRVSEYPHVLGPDWDNHELHVDMELYEHCFSSVLFLKQRVRLDRARRRWKSRWWRLLYWSRRVILRRPMPTWGETAGSYIRQRLKEESFARKILLPDETSDGPNNEEQSHG